MKNFGTRFVMDSNSFWKFYLIYCRNANSGLRSRRRFGGVGFLTTLGVGVGFFVRFRKSNWITFTAHSSVEDSCWIGRISYETFVETENSYCVPRFPPSVSCYKILGHQTSFTLC